MADLMRISGVGEEYSELLEAAGVDTVKELPLTFALRPFDFDTLAVRVYQYASDERVGAALIPALLILSLGLMASAARLPLARAEERAPEAELRPELRRRPLLGDLHRLLRRRHRLLEVARRLVRLVEREADGPAAPVDAVVDDAPLQRAVAEELAEGAAVGKGGVGGDKVVVAEDVVVEVA